MKLLKEHRLKLWFKVLIHEGKSIDGSQEQWSLPCGRHNGNPSHFNQPARYLDKNNWISLPNITGTWLVSNPKVCYRGNVGHSIYVAQPLAPITHKIEGMIWVTQVQLLREATNLDVKPFGIFRVLKQVIDE